jgi:hypothetical protein
MAQTEIASGNHVERTAGLGSDRYDSASFNVANAASDYDIDAQIAAMFSNVKKAYFTEIRTDANISIKLNATDNPVITINSADSPYIIDQIAVTNIYISNASGGAAAVKLLCV